MSFYIINNSLFDDSRYAYGEQFENFNVGEAIYCDKCGKPLTMLKWLPPLEIKVSKKQLGDFIFGTFPNLMISKKVKTLIEETRVSGIKSFTPVNLFYRGKLLDFEYFYTDITISEAKIDLNKSGIGFDPNNICPKCQRGSYESMSFNHMKGIYFKNENEIVDDVFKTKILGNEVVSEKFKAMVENNGISNISLIEAHRFRPSWILS